MTYKLTDIKHETPHFWVLAVDKGHEVYAKGITHSTRVAQIYRTESLPLAIAECDRRQTLKDSP